MPKERIKPPDEPRDELVRQLVAKMRARWTNPAYAVAMLMDLMSSADIKGIVTDFDAIAREIESKIERGAI